MKRPRVQFTLRRLMLAVAALAVLLAATRIVQNHLGPRDGGYTGTYRYLGADWKWHEVRGAVIFVKDGLIFTD